MRTVTIILFVLSGGCAAHPNFNITSSSPAYIEINGEIKCQLTPCTITPPHYVGLFGDCNRLASMRSELIAFPLDKTKGFVQQKSIVARCNDNKNIYFDMIATGGVRVKPVME